jgi:hypothetical protein
MLISYIDMFITLLRAFIIYPKVHGKRKLSVNKIWASKPFLKGLVGFGAKPQGLQKEEIV